MVATARCSFNDEEQRRHSFDEVQNRELILFVETAQKINGKVIVREKLENSIAGI